MDIPNTNSPMPPDTNRFPRLHRDLIVTIKMQRREDGGLQVWGEPPGGLILSGANPEEVIAKIWPALVALKADPQFVPF